MTKEMELFRKMLDDNGIEWHDASDMGVCPITRTRFGYRGCDWSVIHGYGTWGGYSRFRRDDGLLELMSGAVNDGDPVGYLTAKEAFDYVIGNNKEEAITKHEADTERPNYVITPEEFLGVIEKFIADKPYPEEFHSRTDELMEELLTSFGYGEGIKAIQSQIRWYA